MVEPEPPRETRPTPLGSVLLTIHALIRDLRMAGLVGIGLIVVVVVVLAVALTGYFHL